MVIRDSLLTGLALAALVAFGSLIPLSSPASRLASLQISSTRSNSTITVPQEKTLQKTGTSTLGIQPNLLLPSSVESRELASSSCADTQPEIPCVAHPILASIAALGHRGQALSWFQTNPQGQFQSALNSVPDSLNSELSGLFPSAAGQPFTVQHSQLTSSPAAYHRGVR